MLLINNRGTSVTGAEHFKYLSEHGTVVGTWHGQASGLLGVEGHVVKDEFVALYDNLHPVTRDKLTVRQVASKS